MAGRLAIFSAGARPDGQMHWRLASAVVDHAAARSVVGDAVDFWRVEEAIPGQLLRLHAEMIMPGRGWLQFSITSDSDKTGRSQPKLTVTAFYEPHGLTGYLYWLATMPLHRFIFLPCAMPLARRAVLLHRSAQTGVEPTTMAIQSGKLQ